MMDLKKPRIYQSSACIFGLLSLLIACSSFPSQNIDPAKNNKATFQKDFAECKEDYPESTTGVHYKLWAGCMNLKGWK
jgi:hypothetical protein